MGYQERDAAGQRIETRRRGDESMSFLVLDVLNAAKSHGPTKGSWACACIKVNRIGQGEVGGSRGYMYDYVADGDKGNHGRTMVGTEQRINREQQLLRQLRCFFLRPPSERVCVAKAGK